MPGSWLWRRCSVPLLAAALLEGAPAQSVRVLVLTGQSDPAHDWRQTTSALEEILAAAGGFAVEIVTRPQDLDPAALERADVIIVNYNGPRWGERVENAIESFLAGGKGLVSFHGVSYGPFMGTEQQGGRWVHNPEAAWKAWPEMLGAFWAPADIGHSIPHTFRVRIADRQHPVTRDMPPEFTIRDELYHRLSLRPAAQVLATAFSDPAMRGTGKDEPVCWAVRYGGGRAFHTTLGHDATTLRSPGLATLLVRAIEWAARSSVSAARWLELPSPAPRPTARPRP